MGDITLSELQNNGYSVAGTPTSTQGNGISMDSLQKSGFTSKVEYTPPSKEYSILDHVIGITKPIAEMPKLLGSGIQMFGDLISPDNNPNGDTLGDRLVRQGLAMKENNEKWVKERYPEAGNILEEAYQQSPVLATAIGLGKLLGHKVAGVALATGMGVAAFPEAYDELRRKGDIKPAAVAKAAAVGLGVSIPALLGFSAFEAESGTVLQQTLKHTANAALGGFAQSVGAGAVETAVGLKEFKGAESLSEIIGQGAHDAAVWAILGGAYGAHAAMANERGIFKALKDTGMPETEAQAKTTELMRQSTGKVMDWVEQHVNATDEQKSRIFTQRPDVMKRMQQLQEKMSTGAKLDPTDYDFLPKEKEPLEAADKLQAKIDRLTQVRSDVKLLQDALKGETEHTEYNKKIADETKETTQMVNDTHDQILDESNKKFEDAVKAQEKLFADESKGLEAEKRSAEAEYSREGKAHEETKQQLEKEQTRLMAKGLETSDRAKTLEAKISEHEQKTSQAQDKITAAQDKIDAATEKHRGTLEDMKQADTHNKAALESIRQQDIEESIKHLPTIEATRKALESSQAEAERLRKAITERKEELRPKGSELTQLKRELASLERGARKGRQNTLADAKDVQQRLSKMIKDKETGLLEAKDFKKFDTLIRKTLTQEDLAEAIPTMKRMIQQLNERAQQKEWRDDLKKLKIDKLPVPYQDALGPILDSLDLHFRTGKDMQVKQATLDFFEKKMAEGSPNGKLDYGEALALKAAQKRSITEMTHEEFSALYQAIMSTAAEGKRLNELVAQREEKNFANFLIRGLQRMAEMTGGKPLVIEKNTAKIDARKLNRGMVEKIWDGVKWWGNAQIQDEELIRRAGAQELFQALHEGHQQMRDDNIQDVKIIQKFFKALNVPDALTKPIPKEFKDAEGNITFTGKDALTLNAYMKIYAQSQNENGLRHLIGDAEKGTPGSGFSRETIMDVQDWLETEYPDATKAVRDMFDYFAPGSKAFSRLEEAVIKDKGHRIAVEDNYDPIQRLVNVPHEDFAWGNKGLYGRGVMNSGFINPRVESSLAFRDFDYMGDIVRHIQDTNAYINLNGPLRDIQKYIDDPRVQQVARAVHGDELIPALQKLVNDVAFNGHQMDGAVSKLYSNFRQKFVFAQIGFNALSALKEFTQFAPSATEVGWGWQSKAMAQHIFDIKGTNAFIDSKSLMMKNQAFTQEQVFIEMTRQGARSLGPPGMDQNLRQVGLWMHQEVYRMVSRATWLGAYNRYMVESRNMGLELGESDKAAVDYADALTRKTHPVSGDLYTPGAFRHGDLGRTLGMFHSAITRNYNLFASDIEQVKEGNMKPMEAVVKGVSRTFISALILGVISQRRALQKDEMPAYMLDVSLGSDVLYGMFTKAYVDGKFRGMENPAGQALGAVYGVFDSNNTPERRMRDLAEAGADFSGLPFGVLYRELTGKSFQPKPDRS